MAPSIEQRLVKAILGRDRASALDTDAYKLSMAQAGFPLRPEAFCMTFRRGDGPWHNPFDLREVIELFRPELPDLKERGFLQTWGYGLTPAMEMALGTTTDVWAVPKGAWFSASEPIIVPYSASFFSSWLEPLSLMLQYPIQVATAALNGEREFDCTCVDDAKIVRIACEAVGIVNIKVNVREAEYRERVRANALAVVEALGGEAERAFEVGLRAATCFQQHRIVLEELRRVGIVRTSNLRLAYELNLIPVGTTGHEHQQRYGIDVNAFRAIRDSRPETPSYLFDTYDPMKIGIPAIMRVVSENPAARCSFRFDSGDQDAQFRRLWEFARKGCPHAAFIFEDSYTADKVADNERFLAVLDFPREQAWYGFGGYFVSQPSFTPYTRDTVSAAYKLCETSGQPRMKFSGSPGKQSHPGRPVTFVRIAEPTVSGQTSYDRLVGQRGEEPPEGFVLLEDLSPTVDTDLCERTGRVGRSDGTLRLVRAAERERDEMYAALAA